MLENDDIMVNLLKKNYDFMGVNLLEFTPLRLR
jgi:hypothetical protein